jgi:hypothetical protein
MKSRLFLDIFWLIRDVRLNAVDETFKNFLN